MISHILETREFLDKILLCDIQVEEVHYEFFDKVIETNKWLRFEDWLQIDDNLKKILSSCPSVLLEEFPDKKIQIANINIHITKIPLNEFYVKALALDLFNVIPSMLEVKVSQIKVGELNKRIEYLEKQREKARCRSCRKKNKGRIAGRKDVCPEYDPVQVTRGLTSNIAPYAPYTPSVKINNSKTDNSESRQEGEPYSPKPLSNCSDFNFEVNNIENIGEDYTPASKSGDDSVSDSIPTYKPSTIIKSAAATEVDIDSLEEIAMAKGIKKPVKKTVEGTESISNELESLEVNNYATKAESGEKRSRKRKRNPENSNNKCRLSLDLFGTDDSENEKILFDNELSTKARTIKKEKGIKLEKDDKCINDSPLKTKDDKQNMPKPQRSDEEDNNEKKLKYAQHIQAKTDDKTKLESIQKSGWILSKPAQEEGKASNKYKSKTSLNTKQSPSTKKHKKENKERKFETLDEIPLKEDVKKLNHLSNEELVSTFEEFKPLLDKHFREQRRQKSHIVKGAPDLDNYLTMSVLKMDKILPMMNCLKEHYEVHVDEKVPLYTDVVMNLMLPEWILAIFMKEYNLCREAAINKMRQQQEYDISDQSI